MSHPAAPLPIYDADAALRFSMAWTGHAAEIVQRVLDARFRYLQLAGIVQDDEDDGLLRERSLVRHLLPEGPGCIDGRATAYVVQATGLEPGIVESVERAELAYLDTLGLVEWADAAEREARLGAPVPPFDATAPALRGGHGDHWACLITGLEPVLAGLATAPPPADLRIHAPAFNPVWTDLTVSGRGEAPGLETWRVDGWRPGEARLLSAFPVIRDGDLQLLTLGTARPWDSGFEAVVPATTSGGLPLAYFDVAHLHPWNEWAPDQAVPVRLAGLAYRLAPAAAEPPADATALAPLDGGQPDEFAFRGFLRAVARVTAWGQELYRLELDLEPATAGRPALQLPVLVAKHRLPLGYRPCAGDPVQGVMWLQGLPEGLAFPVLSGD